MNGPPATGRTPAAMDEACANGFRLLLGGADAGKVGRDAGVEAGDALCEGVDSGDQREPDGCDDERVLNQILTLLVTEENEQRKFIVALLATAGCGLDRPVGGPSTGPEQLYDAELPPPPARRACVAAPWPPGRPSVTSTPGSSTPRDALDHILTLLPARGGPRRSACSMSTAARLLCAPAGPAAAFPGGQGLWAASEWPMPIPGCCGPDSSRVQARAPRNSGASSANRPLQEQVVSQVVAQIVPLRAQRQRGPVRASPPANGPARPSECPARKELGRALRVRFQKGFEPRDGLPSSATSGRALAPAPVGPRQIRGNRADARRQCSSSRSG